MLNHETLIIAAAGLASAMVVIVLAWWVRDRGWKPEDVTIGFVGPSLGAVYLLLFALALAAEWQTISDAGHAASSEATATRELYLSAAGLPPGSAAGLRQRTLQYAAAVVRDDWPQMRHHVLDDRTARMLASMTSYVLRIDPPDAEAANAQQQALARLGIMDNTREQRAEDAAARLPWGVLAGVITTSVVVAAFPFAGGIPAARVSIAVAALQVALMTIGVVVVFQLDHPFSGPLAVAPGAMQSVISQLTAPW
jgi:hypothetical protein